FLSLIPAAISAVSALADHF
uniref:Phylloseptin-Az6 n=1 Tax=Pithecopus azureus TaxID=2034991 RepID=PLS6_PITAZ|nr:RecName: Full=Phylloseptin-Az6; Short=PLS-Az6; AltName: Full=Phylloseptin-14; Short=PS-14 [Pithecopus azureus]